MKDSGGQSHVLGRSPTLPKSAKLHQTLSQMVQQAKSSCCKTAERSVSCGNVGSCSYPTGLEAPGVEPPGVLSRIAMKSVRTGGGAASAQYCLALGSPWK